MNNLGSIFAVAGIVTAVFSVVMVVLLVLVQQRRQIRYDEVRQRAELETIRKSFEQQVYDLNDRLMATEKRWQDANHLLISSQIATPDPATEVSRRVHISEFLRSVGISESDLTVDHELVFVLTPFHPEYNETYSAIQAVCNKVGLQCRRGDEQDVRGDILHHVLRLLVKARVVVANVDGRNPNVFYELGIAHALDKGTILVSQSVTDLPADIKSKRVVVFRNPEDLQDKLRDELTKVFVRP